MVDMKALIFAKACSFIMGFKMTSKIRKEKIEQSIHG